ncbi:MAG: heat-inducible transcriptional repressor [Blastocatellia bacterium]|nr:heat-inducible transcriptional repressor [Blastocatellia bacterium]
MVCGTSGYFVILAAALKVFYLDCSSPNPGFRSREMQINLMARTSSSNKSGRPTPDSRRGAVLSAIIEEHLVTGDAIGSHTVSDRFANATGWSSATIRSVMCDLEDFGLLEQPHTSAGRIPTDKGYRYYVDNMLDSTRLSKNDLRAIERIDHGHDGQVRPDRLMEKASHVLSELSENVGIVVWPSLAENRLKHIRFMRLPDSRILVVLVSASNIVHDKVITLDEDFTQDELDRTARYLNAEFGGKSLLTIRDEMIALMKEEKALYDKLLHNAMLLCERSLQDEDEATAEVYLDGASNILAKPEFASAEGMRELFRTFEAKSRLIKILNECVASNSAGGNVRVVIGRENIASSMKRCSVITTSYRVGGDVSGTLGVVGPMRIEYGRLMAVVNYLARFIERALLNEASLQ